MTWTPSPEQIRQAELFVAEGLIVPARWLPYLSPESRTRTRVQP